MERDNQRQDRPEEWRSPNRTSHAAEGGYDDWNTRRQHGGEGSHGHQPGHQRMQDRYDYGRPDPETGGYRQGQQQPYQGGASRGQDERGGRHGYGDDHYGGQRERGFMERASDEVSSWFGDEGARQRRAMGAHRGKGPKGYTRSDDRIRDDVSDRLSDDDYVDASDIEVTVERGEVTLSGEVGSRQEKRLAEDCVERVAGVTHVQNNLRVKSSSRHATPDDGKNPAQSGVIVAGTRT